LSFESVFCDHNKYILHTGGDERGKEKKRKREIEKDRFMLM
jgi:hypothetical protein